jgi:TetR/AcrR family transcriptional repressor of nem operon
VPRDSTRTRRLLLDAAQDLVTSNGFAGTSVDQILEASGSSKGAFFHHFPSKRALAHALVERWVDGDLQMLATGIAAADAAPDPVGRVLAFVGHYETWAESLLAEDTACLYIAALAERDLLDDATIAEIDRSVRGWRTAFADLLRDAYAAAGPRDAPDPDELADHLFVTFEGAFLLCRTVGSPAPMRAQLRVFRQLLEALLSPG